jgi:mRNA interferase RelE/StbE
MASEPKWKVELSLQADREVERLDPNQARRILKFLFERVARLDNPRSIGEALQGPRFGEFWKYRVGDYRLVCKIEDERLLVLVLRIGHRREIYRP